MSPPHTWFGASTNWIAGPIHEPFRRWFGCRGKEEPAIPGGSRSVPARRCHQHAKRRGRLTPRQRPSVLLVSRCVARIAVSRRNVLCDVASRKIRGSFFNRYRVPNQILASGFWIPSSFVALFVDRCSLSAAPRLSVILTPNSYLLRTRPIPYLHPLPPIACQRHRLVPASGFSLLDSGF